MRFLTQNLLLKNSRIRNRSNLQNIKKTTKFDYNHDILTNNLEKTNLNGRKKKEGNLPKPLPSFSFFRPLLSLLPTTIYINKKKKQKNFKDSLKTMFHSKFSWGF